MRIASVISSASDTADYDYQWVKCSKAIELESGRKMVIERPEWKIFVFNGRDNFYCNPNNFCWRFSNLVQGLKEIFLSHKTAEFAVLFHAISEDIEDLKKMLFDGLEKTNVDPGRIHYLGYHSGEDLYEKVICKFKSHDNLDQLFDSLWSEIHKHSQSGTTEEVQYLSYQNITPDIDENFNLRAIKKIGAFKHQGENIVGSIRGNANQALTEKPDAVYRIKPAWIEKLLKKYEEIAPFLDVIGLNSYKEVNTLLQNAMDNVLRINFENQLINESVDAAFDCADNIQSAAKILGKAMEQYKVKVHSS